jgi:acyl-CoA synthetase (AMP-forming)/AMP-acid ligase II
MPAQKDIYMPDTPNTPTDPPQNTSEETKVDAREKTQEDPKPVKEYSPAEANAPYNIAEVVTQAALSRKDELAVISPKEDSLGRLRVTFKELDHDSQVLATVLRDEMELTPGERVLVMVGPGADFYTVVFGLFKAGLVPVMVDPGMGLKRMLQCLSEGCPSALVGIKKAQLLSLLFPSYFKEVKRRVTIGKRLGWSGKTLQDILKNPPQKLLPTENTMGSDTAAILFTSGATGPPKGVIYTHHMFKSQVEAIRNNFQHVPGTKELVTFPLFGLFTPALGLTSVIADMNPTKPGTADPKKIMDTIAKENIKSLFASPALLSRLSQHAGTGAQKLSGVNVIISAGAPAQPSLISQINSMLDKGAKLYTPYGATEAMPLTRIDAEDIERARGMTEQGFGMCVGSPLPGCQIKVIGIKEEPLKSFSEKDILPQGEVGELVACGPMVAQSYFQLPDATALTMLLGPNGQPWRRMGDVGWRDVRGFLWFCGRKSQRVVTKTGTLYTVPCESIFLNHPQVNRAALVGLGEPGHMTPVMIVEPKTRLSSSRWKAFLTELLALAKTNPRTRNIKHFLARRNFPLDIRHNAKISREKLAQWARRELSTQNVQATDFYRK